MYSCVVRPAHHALTGDFNVQRCSVGELKDPKKKIFVEHAVAMRIADDAEASSLSAHFKKDSPYSPMFNRLVLECIGNIYICITKASSSWTELFLVIERSEIQGGSSVFSPNRNCWSSFGDLTPSDCRVNMT